MSRPLSAPLEGVVVIIVDEQTSARATERTLSNAGAAVFVAHDEAGTRSLLSKISPHFALIDPAALGGHGPATYAWALFSDPEFRTIVYSDNVRDLGSTKTRWLIDKSRPPSAVVDAIGEALKDSSWLHKGGDDVKPAI